MLNNSLDIYFRDPDFLYAEDLEKQASFLSGIRRALTRGARAKLLRDAKLVRDEVGGFNAYSTLPKDVKRNLLNDFQQSLKGDYSRLSGLRDRLIGARGNQDVIDSLRFNNFGTPGASFRSLANAENKALEAATRYGAKPAETGGLLSRLFSRRPKSTPSKAPSTAATSSPVTSASNVVDNVTYPLVPVGGGRAMPSAADMFRFSNSSLRRPNNPLVPVADNPMLPSVINNTGGAATRGLTNAGELGLPYYGELANVGRTGAKASKYTKRPMSRAKSRVVEGEVINLPPSTQQGLARASANLENSIVNPASTALVPAGGKAAPSTADMFRFATDPSKNSNRILEEAAKATSNRTANTAARNAIGKPTSAWSKAPNSSISREELAELINNAANSSRGLAWKVGLGSALGGGLLGTVGSRIFAPDPTIQYIQPSTQYYRQPEFIY